MEFLFTVHVYLQDTYITSISSTKEAFEMLINNPSVPPEAYELRPVSNGVTVGGSTRTDKPLTLLDMFEQASGVSFLLNGYDDHSLPLD